MILLNCDMGEGMDFDREIMPLVDMANLACGAHAGSLELMNSNVLLAKMHDVDIGAHPSYPDRENFGRASMCMSREDLMSTIIDQISLLDGVCASAGVALSYVKPHGALYNDMMADEELFGIAVESVARYSIDLKLMILSSPQNAHYAKIASKHKLELLYELFADRNYTDEGSLVPRAKPNAVIESAEEIVSRIRDYMNTGTLKSINAKPLELIGDSLCVHGDNLESLEIIKSLRAIL